MFIIISTLLFSSILCTLNYAIKNEDYLHKSSFSTLLSISQSSISLSSSTSSPPSSQLPSSLFSSLPLSLSLSSSKSLLHKSHKKNLNKSSFNPQLERIYQLLNSDHPPRKARHLSAPSYMIHLYKSLSNTDTGEPIAPKPYNATIIRSFQRTVYSSVDMQFHFNISTNLLLNEKLLGAEFRIFKLKPKLKDGNKIPKSHLFEVKIFQVLSSNSNEKRLLDSRRMSLNSVGWEVFYVKKALLDWIKDTKTNYGLLLTVNTLLHEAIESPLFRWVKTHHHQINRRPVLIIFTSNNQSYQSNERIGKSYELINTETGNTKKRTPLKSFFMNTLCNKHDHFIFLHHLNISEWIIYPKSYNSYSCDGSCLNDKYFASRAIIKDAYGHIANIKDNNEKENKNNRKMDDLLHSASCYNGYFHSNNHSNNNNNHHHHHYKSHFSTPLASHHQYRLINKQQRQEQQQHYSYKKRFYPRSYNNQNDQEEYSLVNDNENKNEMQENSCFPLAFTSLDILYFNRFGDAIIRQIPDMIIKQCGCVYK